MAAIRPDRNSVARDQFAIFDAVCSETAIPDDERRRLILHLSAAEWLVCQRIRSGGPVPATVDIPAILPPFCSV
ncbi:MAG: hypothetical protein JO122_03405 [Acetobacteraceae bacterium]|nr:hypothetical protein [Acetobacteraceae bacterium]